MTLLVALHTCQMTKARLRELASWLPLAAGGTFTQPSLDMSVEVLDHPVAPVRVVQACDAPRLAQPFQAWRRSTSPLSLFFKIFPPPKKRRKRRFRFCLREMECPSFSTTAVAAAVGFFG